MQFNDIVDKYEYTCFACPTQVEGVLKDGRKFYFRYRYGWAELNLNIDNKIERFYVSKQFGDAYDGVLSDEEFRSAFIKLYEDAK